MRQHLRYVMPPVEVAEFRTLSVTHREEGKLSAGYYTSSQGRIGIGVLLAIILVCRVLWLWAEQSAMDVQIPAAEPPR